MIQMLRAAGCQMSTDPGARRISEEGPGKLRRFGDPSQAAGSLVQPLPCRCCTRTSADLHGPDAGALGQLTDHCHVMHLVSAFDGDDMNEDIN